MSIKSTYLSAAALGGISRLLSIGIRFVSVPLAISLLSQERYGLWLIVTSLVGWLGFSDLGIPSALQNRLIHVLAAKDESRAKNLVGFSVKMLLGLALVIFVIGLASAFVIPWARVFKFAPSLQGEFIATFCLCVLALSFGLPSRLGSVIFNSHGKLAMPPMADIAAQLCSLALLLMAVFFQWKSLFILALCSLAAMIAGPLWLTFRAMRAYQYKIQTEPASSEDKKAVMGKGVFFSLAVIGELMILQSDALVVGSKLGPEAVPLLLLPMALFLNMLQMQNVFLKPLWPLLTKAHVAEERGFFKGLLAKCLGYSALLGLGFCLFCIFAGDWFMNIWSHSTVGMSPLMAWGMGIYGLVASIDNAINACLNAVGMIEARFLYILACGILKITTAIVVLHHWGLDSLPASYALLGLATGIPFAIFAFRRIFPKGHQ